MQERIAFKTITPEGLQALGHPEAYLRRCGLEPSLLELIRLRTSQNNGCAYCIDMHTKDARARGETEPRLYALSVWRETPFFTERERAALAWTEAVTEVARSRVLDHVYQLARQQFGERDLVDLTLAVVAINGWNRLTISFREPPGTYRPHEAEHRPVAETGAAATRGC